MGETINAEFLKGTIIQVSAKSLLDYFNSEIDKKVEEKLQERLYDIQHKYLSSEEVMEMLGNISRSTLHRLMKSGKIIRRGGSKKFLRCDIEAYMQDRAEEHNNRSFFNHNNFIEL